jgi:hypothetical protein
MTRLGVTNVLLGVIAICLCLIVVKIYDINVVSEAHATEQSATRTSRNTTTAEPLAVRVTNVELPCRVFGAVDAHLMHSLGSSWQPVMGQNGAVHTVVQTPAYP